MIVILDVSAAIEILFLKEKSVQFQRAYNEGTWVIAPDLYVSELTNVLWKYAKAGLLSQEECIQYTEDGLGMIDDFMDSKDLWKEALTESIKNNHPVYDMIYAVLTRRNGGILITNDRKLSEMCETLHIGCLF